jgi:hypothetical protein
MKKLLSLFLIALVVTTVTGCQGSSKSQDMNMSPEEHAKMTK